MERPLGAEPEGKFIEAAGVRLHYHEMGAGSPLICLHGAGPGANAWSNFKFNAGAFAAAHRTFLVDMPQYGRSDKVVIEGGRLTFTARVLDAFMEAVGLPSADFVGNSMGGQVALKMAIDTPRRVNRVAVLGATPVSFTALTPLPVEGVRLIQRYYRGEGPTQAKMRALMETLVSTPGLITDEMVEERYAASADPEVVALFTKHPPQNQDLFADLDKITAPTFLIWGQDDRFGALEVGLLMLKRLAHARMVVLPRCGHWAHMERADEFNHLVLDFFARR